jgi:hypothetical protein
MPIYQSREGIDHLGDGLLFVVKEDIARVINRHIGITNVSRLIEVRIDLGLGFSVHGFP